MLGTASESLRVPQSREESLRVSVGVDTEPRLTPGAAAKPSVQGLLAQTLNKAAAAEQPQNARCHELGGLGALGMGYMTLGV